MSQIIRTRGNNEYLYARTYDKDSKKYHEVCLGNVKSLPKILKPDNFSLVPTREGFIASDFFKAMECSHIDDALTILFIEALECYTPVVIGGFGDNHVRKVAGIVMDALKFTVKKEGVPPYIVEALQTLLSNWRDCSPVFENSKIKKGKEN